MEDDNATTKILVVDDEPDLRELLRANLSMVGYDVITASNGIEAYEKIESESPDLVILDVMMPRMSGMDVLKKAKDNFFTNQIPIIVLTSRGEVTDVISGIEVGADDYLVKPFNNKELMARIKMILRRTKSSREANPLTGLPGNTAIQREIQRQIDNDEKFAVAYYDLDNFKAYNDRYGYSAGDNIIKFTARLISEIYQAGHEKNFIGHLGGDDFIAISPPEDAEVICQTVADNFDREIRAFYKSEDLEKGYIVSVDRQGNLQKFPIMTISIGIVTNQHRSIKHCGQVAQIAAELKKYAKQFNKSLYIKDRRKNADEEKAEKEAQKAKENLALSQKISFTPQ